MSKQVSILLWCCALSISATPAAGQQRSDSIVTLNVAGANNATPTIAAAGRFVAVAWGATVPNQGADVVVATSRDGGQTFGPPVRVNTARGEAQLASERPPRIALVPRAGEPDVLVFWTARDGSGTSLKRAGSTDGGRTFGRPSLVHAPGAPGNRGWASVTIDERGTAHVIWLDHRGSVASGTEHQHGTATTAAARDGVAMAQRSGLYYAAVSGEQGSERELTRGVCYCCKTAVAAGPGGLIVSAWRHVYPGDLRDIALVLSRDRGRTFSAPARVSEDGWSINGCPEDGPALVVDGTGLIHIAWPTVLPGTEPRGALFYATTRDGRAFTPRQRIPTLGGPKPEHVQLALNPAGGLLVAWEELVAGRRTVATISVSRDAGGRVAFGTPRRQAVDDVARQPAVAFAGETALVSWVASGTSGVTGQGNDSRIAVAVVGR